jgi:hypothetical protein
MPDRATATAQVLIPNFLPLTRGIRKKPDDVLDKHIGSLLCYFAKTIAEGVSEY